MNDVTILPLHGKSPRIDPSAFIAPGCRIIGDVFIGAGASIWYNCVIRADVNYIHIGAQTNVQDGTVIHCDSSANGAGGFPTVIGEGALIGHMSILHGCTIKDRGFVGLGAIVMDGCVVESDAMLAAGAMLTPNKTVPMGELWGGRPARMLRTLDHAAIIGIRKGVDHYVHNAEQHKIALNAR